MTAHPERNLQRPLSNDAALWLRALEASSEAIVIADPDERILAKNRAFNKYMILISALSHGHTDQTMLSLSSGRDDLTGLLNRTAMFAQLKIEIERVTRNGPVLAVLFVDLDRFKQVNDKYGHLVGDDLLQAVGHRIRATVRRSDLIARVGGDEFVVVLSDVGDRTIARNIAEKIGLALEQPFAIRHHSIKISASIGVSFLGSNLTTPEALVDAADKGMYLAKALPDITVCVGE